MNSGKALWVACLNADGIRGVTLEMDHSPVQHGRDIFLFNEIHLGPGQAFRFKN